MKKGILGVLLFITVCFVFTGCEKNSSKNSIVGKWAYGDFIYIFEEDGTCNYDAAGTMMKCTYKTDGDKLSILYEGSDVSFDTTYNIKDNRLNVKDSFGNDTFYDRQ